MMGSLVRSRAKAGSGATHCCGGASCRTRVFVSSAEQARTVFYFWKVGLVVKVREKKQRIEMVPVCSVAWCNVAGGNRRARAPRAIPARALTPDLAPCTGSKVHGVRPTVRAAVLRRSAAGGPADGGEAVERAAMEAAGGVVRQAPVDALLFLKGGAWAGAGGGGGHPPQSEGGRGWRRGGAAHLEDRRRPLRGAEGGVASGSGG